MKSLLVMLFVAVSALIASPGASGRETGRDRVDEAFFFAFPVYQMAATRARTVTAARGRGVEAVNSFTHRTRLATPADRTVTTPNNDTVYSSAWLDLSRGPVELTVPTIRNRYNSVALMSLFTDNFRILGTRDGGGGGRYWITGPKWRGATPKGLIRVSSPTNDVWALVRVLVTGPSDLAAAIAAQQSFVVTAARGRGPDPLMTPAAEPTPKQLLDVVNEMLGRGPLPAAVAARVRQLRAYGIRPGESGVFDRLPGDVRRRWQDEMPRLMDTLRLGMAASSTTVNGWSYPKSNIGNFDKDDRYRAAVALGGLAAMPVDEAVYPSTQGDGRNCGRLTVPARVPTQTQGFWSLTMYEVTPEGRQFLVANPLQRYAIGDRTEGLKRRSDGSVAIWICAKPPTNAEDNWLPAPAGPWQATFRIYRPAPIVRNAIWRLPAITADRSASALSGPLHDRAALFDKMVTALRLDGAALVIAHRTSSGWTDDVRKFAGTMKSDSQIPIASATKWFTTTVIASLVDERRFSFDKPISTCLPGFTGDLGAVTLRELLTHSSGVPALPPGREASFPTLAASVDQLRDVALAARPGTKMIYTGTAFQIASRCVETLESKDFRDLFKSQVALPLGLLNTRYGYDGAAPLTGGGIVTTPRDLETFTRAVFERRLLSPG